MCRVGIFVYNSRAELLECIKSILPQIQQVERKKKTLKEADDLNILDLTDIIPGEGATIIAARNEELGELEGGRITLPNWPSNTF